MARRSPPRTPATRARRAPPTRARSTGPASGEPRAWTRDGAAGFAPTFLQFPTRPSNARTLEHREDAILATYNGTLRMLVDLGRILISEDGFQSGLVDTIAHGILGMPLSWLGPEDMIAALTDSHGTPGEWGKMHPENETAKVFADGVVFNAGLGQYVFGADDLIRPIGVHRVPRLMWRDPRWLRRDPYTLQWFFMGRGGEVPINPGDGEWVLFQPYPDTDSWRHGPILYMSLAAIFARDTLFDRQRVSEVCAPTRIARAVKPTTVPARKKMAANLAKMAHDNQITMSHEWLYEIVSASAGDYWQVCGEIITWARQMVEVGLTGNILSIEGPTGFSNADIYRRVTDSRRRFYAASWVRCIREQGLSWWVRDNYGEAAVARCPVPVYNTESPEDASARAGAMEAWGKALKSISDGLTATNTSVVLEPSYVIELLQRANIRAVVKAAPAPPVETAPQATSADPAQAIAPEADDEEPADSEEGARLAGDRASAMNAARMLACRHGRTNDCRHCRVRGHWMPDAKGKWGVTWSALVAPAAPAPREAVAA